VAAFVQAGRGLAAAHDLGLVHRDFKPENVMVEHDLRGAHAFRRVRVTDFGLVTRSGETASTLGDGSSRDESLTRTGMSVGTPAYMAPEQHFGGRLDARADQFAFCVSLHEALHGERPFRGETFLDLARRKHAGEMTPPRLGGKLPRWLAAIVARGLAPEAADRFPSMHALLDALLHGLRRPARTRRILGKLGFAAALATLATTAVVDVIPPGTDALQVYAGQPPGCLASALPSPALASAAAFVSLPCTSPPPF
jgi:serine/threonine protein kinase